MYQALADLVLVLHASIVLFVVGGLVVVIIGNARQWNWVNAAWFRVAHLIAIAVVVLQAWAGVICPLTTLESWLRIHGGSPGYTSSFIEHWMQRALFYEAPSWVFTLLYTAFAAMVAATWWRYPPTRKPGTSLSRASRSVAAEPKAK